MEPSSSHDHHVSPWTFSTMFFPQSLFMTFYMPLSKGSNYISSRGYELIRLLVPPCTLILFQIQSMLVPLTATIEQLPIVAPLLDTFFKCLFLIGFVVLLFFEQSLRSLLTWFIGKHPTGHPISVVNAMDPTFDFFDHTIPHTRHLENNDLFQQRAQQAADKEKLQTGKVPDPIKMMVHRPDYSLSLAYTLSVASKLGYEDLNVIKYELAQAGFDVKDTFRPFAYKNICAYVVEKDDVIFLVFRGSNPLNIQNYLTNIDIRMRDVYAPWGYMGRVHKGYFDALGDPPLPTSTYQKEEQTASSSSNNPSVWQWLFQKSMDHVTGPWMHQLMDPVDYRFVDPKHSQDHQGIRDTSMYIQAESYILELMQRQQHKKLYITGHSLGAALATMFLAKMVQSNSPLFQHLGGLYTFGQPKLGDHQFSKIFDAKLSSKIFHHTYNNDVFTRLPSYSEYAAPPGTLVFIDSAYEITIYPPGPKTNTPVAVRPISHLHLSGLLNRHVLHRLANENWIRILFRVLAPYMINDHFAADYPKCLQHGHITWVIMEEEDQSNHPHHRFSLPNNAMTPLGGDAQKTQRPSLIKRRSSRINVAEIDD